VNGECSRATLGPKINTRIAGFEVDFAWPGLVVEIDGPGHARPRARLEGASRDAALKRAGYPVLRLAGQDL
jgi:very-short-patch-repair endonuclease